MHTLSAVDENEPSFTDGVADLSSQFLAAQQPGSEQDLQPPSGPSPQQQSELPAGFLPQNNPLYSPQVTPSSYQWTTPLRSVPQHSAAHYYTPQRTPQRTPQHILQQQSTPQHGAYGTQSCADDEDMDISWRAGETSSNSLMPRMFDGSSTVDVRDWSCHQRREAIKATTTAHANGKDTPNAADLLSLAEVSIAPDSPAYAAFKQIRAAANDHLRAANDGKILTYQPTTPVLQAALGANFHDPSHVLAACTQLQARFELLQQQADHEGLLIQYMPTMRVSGTKTPQPVFLLVDGERISPQTYAYNYVMTLFEIRFSVATLDQENALRTLKQGQFPAEQYAMQLRRLAAKLTHTGRYTDQHLVLLFLEGLSNRECARAVTAQIQGMHNVSPTLDDALLRVNHWMQMSRQTQLVQLEAQAAAIQMLPAATKTSKTPMLHTPSFSLGSSSGGGNRDTVSALKQQARQLALEQHGPNHRDAPCTLRGHRGHSNAECAQQLQQQQQRAAPSFAPPTVAGAAQYGFGSAGAGYTATAGVPTPYPAGAAMQSGGAGRSPAMQNHFNRWNGKQQQQSGGRTLSSPPPARPPGLQQAAAGQDVASNCGVCGYKGGHSGECYYDNPKAAPPTWRPSPSMPWYVINHYRQQCVGIGMQPLEPHQPASASARRTVRFAGALHEEPVSYQPDADADGGESVNWLAAGLTEVNSSAIDSPTTRIAAVSSLGFEPAAVGTRSKQPHSFLPPDNTQPRSRRVDTSIPAQAGVSNVQLTITLDAPAMQDEVLMTSLKQLLSSSSAPQPPAAAATDPTCHSSSSGGHSAAGETAAAATGLSGHLLQQLLPQPELDPEEIASLLETFKSRQQHPHLHLFRSPTYQEGVSLHTADGRHSLVPRAASDSGCIPNIMAQRYANSVGLPIRDLTAEERACVRAIDGTSTLRIYGRTPPVTIKLAAGTAGEAALKAERGFLVVKGDEAYDMYDLVIGRQLLDKVSGCVFPVLQQFLYCPHLDRGDLTIHTLPVITGRAGTASTRPSSAAALSDALTCLPTCCAVMQDETPMLGSCSSSNSSCRSSSVSEADEPTAAAAADSCEPQPQQLLDEGLIAETPAGEPPRSMPVSTAGTEQAARFYVDLRKANAGMVTPAWGVLAGLLSIVWPILFVLQPMLSPLWSSRPVVALRRILLVLLGPIIWLTCKAGEYMGRGWMCLARVASITMPWVCNTYLKLGRRGRYIAADGRTYVTATGPGGCTNPMFRVIEIHKQVFSWRLACRVMPARAVLLLIVLLLSCLTSTAAMHVRHAVTAADNPTGWVMRQTLSSTLPMAPPFTTFPLLVAGLSDRKEDCFR